MTFPRLILAFVVGLAAMSAAFATDNDGGKADLIFNPPPGYSPPPGEPAPQPNAQPTVQPTNQPSAPPTVQPASQPSAAQPAAQPGSAKTPQQRLSQIDAEIGTVGAALAEKDQEIKDLETKITNLGNLGARNPKWEERLERKKQQRAALAARLSALVLTKMEIVRVLTQPSP